MNLQGFFYWLQRVEGMGYPLALLLVIIALIAFKKARVRSRGILAAMNIFRVVCISIALILYIIELSESWYSSNSYEQGAFNWRIASLFWWARWVMLVYSILLPQLFWFKKLRSNLLLSILTLLPMVFEWIMVILTSFYKDYRPGGWHTTIYPPLLSIIATLAGALAIYSVAVGVTYFILRKINGLPNPTN